MSLNLKSIYILSPVTIKNNLISVYLSSNWKALRPISFLPCNHAFSFNQKDNKMWPGLIGLKCLLS